MRLATPEIGLFFIVKSESWLYGVPRRAARVVEWDGLDNAHAIVGIAATGNGRKPVSRSHNLAGHCGAG
jgi:hypothetical protein